MTLAPALVVVFGLMFGGARPADAVTLDFEGLDATCGASAEPTGTVPGGYGGLLWSQFSVANGTVAVPVECDAHFQGSSYSNTYGAPSPSYAAFNGSGYGEIDAYAPFGFVFTFNGASFSSFNNADSIDDFSAYSVGIAGYRPGDSLFSPTYSGTLDLFFITDDTQHSNFYTTFVANWTGLNLLTFLAGDGASADASTVFGGDGRSFLVDDVNVVSQPIPEPGSVFLLGTGLVAVARAAKRRRRPQRLARGPHARL